ncbi:M13 family metallopeptidase [Roseateles sp.]|uniref:M13 family metallopeptidase n=1 Tax=Roseateles sp. TaxID=1971397 RepID=UPI0025E2F204|nr:M13 family metallopeptidase [Roseateles sp.]MBV8037048.1 M13 family metallopeptidase [Roseateles sp.]
MNVFRLSTLSLMLLGGAALAAAPRSGLDLTGFDRAVRPQDDLFRAANGHWLATTGIPADKPNYGSFIELADLSDKRVREVVESLAATPQKAGSAAQKIVDFYAAHLDMAAIDQAGMAPLKPLLEGVDAIASREQFAAWLGARAGQVAGLVDLDVDADFKQPGINRLLVHQAGLGLPNRDYYLKTDDARMAKARAAYLAYLETLAREAGLADPAAAAGRVMALERRIAELHWDQVANRDPVKLYNPMTPAELAAKAPGLDWQGLLKAAGMPALQRLSVSQPSFCIGLARLVGETPLDELRLYAKLRMLDSLAGVLPGPVRDASFAFHGTALSGATTERPRWQKAVAGVNGALGEAVGQVYVQRYFPAADKARMLTLVGNLMSAYKDSIGTLTWMTPATQAAAQEKLSKYMVKIGYPETWRNYSGLEVRAGDALGNTLRAGRFGWLYQAAKADQPVDRREWLMTPQTVNAYYNPMMNEIVFPAAILQPPFYSSQADDAVNYGAIGAIIGHEISHGFDDEGSQFDGDGALRNWWTEADRKAFDAIGARLVAQYDAYEPIPGKHVNGQLTLGENIADLSGLQIAYKAYLRSLGGKPAPVIDGYSGEQRFFLGWSQAWREKSREQRLLRLLTADPHAPSEFRANGAAVNHDGFHDTFKTQPGDKMFKPAAERIRIW